MGTVIFPGYDPAPGDLLVPLKGVYTIRPGTTVRDIDDMTHRLGGRSAKPQGAISISHGNKDVTIIPALGVTEAAELQEMAYAVLEKRKQRNQREWLAGWRERNGLVPREQFGQALGNALQERVEQHKRNPISDPARQPGYTGRRLY